MIRLLHLNPILILTALNQKSCFATHHDVSVTAPMKTLSVTIDRGFIPCATCIIKGSPMLDFIRARRSLNPVPSMQFLRKTPHTSLETEQASPHEATGTSRAPRQRRRLQQRCTARLLDSSLRGSRALARAVVVWPRAGRNYRGCGIALLLGELRRRPW